MPSEAAGVQCIDPTGGFRENELDAEGYNARCCADVASSRVSRVLSSLFLGSHRRAYKRFSGTASSMSITRPPKILR
jgi:hypothetical protein